MMWIIFFCFTVILISISKPQDNIDANNSTPQANSTKEQTNGSTENLATVIALKMMLKDFQMFSQLDFITPRTMDFIHDEAQRARALIDEDKNNTQVNDALKAKINGYMVQIEKKGELYYRIKKLIEKNKLAEAATLANLKSSQDFILEFEYDDSQLYPLMKHSIPVTDTKPIDILESKLKEYQKQLCINDEDYKKAKRISAFLHANLNTADKIQRLRRLDEMFIKIDHVYKQPIALDNLETYDAQKLLIDSIRCNCKELMVQIITHPKHQSLINQTFALKEPRFLHSGKDDFNDYSPLSYARKEMKNDLAQLLIQYGAKDENKQ